MCTIEAPCGGGVVDDVDSTQDGLKHHRISETSHAGS